MEEYRGYSMGKGSMTNYEGPFGFAPLLEGRTFNGILATYRRTHPKKPVLAVDIAGYGFVFNGMETDEGLAIAMGRHPKRPDTQMVIGNMFEQSTWDDVNSWLKGRKFALALCRPLKPFNQPIPPRDFFDFIDRVTGALDNGGVFFTQVPFFLMEHIEAMAYSFSRELNVGINLPPPLTGNVVPIMEIIKP